MPVAILALEVGEILFMPGCILILSVLIKE
jgi:hypothetical protein